MVWPVCLMVIVLSSCHCGTASQSPNLVLIVADDLGWNDVGFHNPDIISPNIDSLANSGIILNQSYVQPVCSPSRSALMTGVYPFRMGLQHLVIGNGQDVCLPLDKPFFPQILKSHGYSTHVVGKWHLGFCKWECTPTFRGFDSFTGFYGGGEDFYTKESFGGYDFRDSEAVDKDAAGTYSTYQFADRVEEIINDHNTSNPLFIYLPFQSVHTPLQVPDEYLAMYPESNDTDRRILSAMVTSMDDAIGRLVTALQDKGIYDNTLILFTSDNGGWTDYGANNFPLRGGKASVFEGGTRAAAFLHGPLLPNVGVTYDGVLHAVDWFPTLAKALGISYHDHDQDGIDQWESITTLSNSMRTEFVYNMDYHPLPLQGAVAIRVGDYKLIEGFPGLYQNWYEVGAPQTVPKVTIPWLLSLSPDNYIEQFEELGLNPDLDSYHYLFNLKDDPTEQNNLYDQMPDLVKDIQKRLRKQQKRYVPPNYPKGNPLGNPINYGGFWSPGWCK